MALAPCARPWRGLTVTLFDMYRILLILYIVDTFLNVVIKFLPSAGNWLLVFDVTFVILYHIDKTKNSIEYEA